MADYYPLIARAVAGLEKNTGDARRALYERARTALVAQLRSVTPALNESDVTRERLALEESIRKVEAESARQTWVEPTRPEPPHRVRAPAMPRWDEPLPSSGGDQQRKSSAPPSGDAMSRRAASAQPSARSSGIVGGDRYVDPVFDQPINAQASALGASAAPSAAPSQRHPLRSRPSGERRSLLDAGLKDFRTVVSENDEPGEATARAAKPARDVPARDSYAEAPSPEFAPAATTTAAPAGALSPDAETPKRKSPEEQLVHELLDAPAPRLLEPALDDETIQPSGHAYIPPQVHADDEPVHRPRRSFRGIIRLAVAILVCAGLGSGFAVMWPTISQFYKSMRDAPPTETASAPEPAAATPSSRVKNNDRFEPAGAAGTTAPAPALAAAPSAPAATNPGAAVAQRVVLYEEDPNDPQGKRYVGTAVWRTEMITPGPGLSPELAIRADVEIPERRISMTWSLRRNTDPNLPATHTVEIVFKLPQDFSAGGISNVPGILMKAAEQTRGVPLAGLAVKVTNGFFLIGLSSVEADRERNVSLLKERAWFDIPVVFANNRRAILALEKGTPGERAFAEAFRVWRQ